MHTESETQNESEHDTNLGIPEESTPHNKRSTLRWFIIFDLLVITPLLLLAGLTWYINQPSDSFEPQQITIEQGASVEQISDLLEERGVVRSALALQLALRFTQDATKIQAGKYKFENAETTLVVAGYLTSGDIMHELIAVTFVEGMRVRDYAVLADEQLELVATEDFIELATQEEGRLFPETYFVPADISAQELIDLMRETHEQRIAPYVEQLATNELSAYEALILASIIEREANSPESMRTVAGIFLNRLEIGMALQADASIEYVIDTPLNELQPGQLATELRELDSPYNTYLYSGLPPTPIGNPGETAIAAVADPIRSDYIYYITGNDGEFHYAKTYNEHLLNIERYLR